MKCLACNSLIKGECSGNASAEQLGCFESSEVKYDACEVHDQGEADSEPSGE